MTLSATINHRFPGFRLEMDFEVSGTGLTALFGPSGSGKTTCINAISGLLRPDQGRIVINDRPVFDRAEGLNLPARRRRVGHVFQDARLFPHLTVARNLDFGARRSSNPPSAAERARVIEMLGIGHLLERRPATLSGGERQRVALGRALLTKPQLLLLDEPMAALDQARKAEILPHLERLRDEARIPIVFVSHALDDVARLADDIVVVNDGRAVATGPVDEVLSRTDLLGLTGQSEPMSVITAEILRHDVEGGLSELGFNGGKLWVARVDGAQGDAVRLRIAARDVMLALEPPQGISATNQIAGRVAEIRSGPGPYCDIRLICGGSALLARITRRSAERLGLGPGREVIAVIKSVSVNRRAGQGPALNRPAG
ncbi:MAG: molybdenum ABC transporter ATP-binding protein [Paracoccaceae bacterium]|nr:molybdenum ABC transporter ATP-binding protein [Paracoccaceae bacterium]